MQFRSFLLLPLFAAIPVLAQVPADLMLVDAAPNDTFNSPLAVRAPSDGSGRVFVVEQCGTIKIIKDGAVLATPFLSLSVACNSEQGLLGLAFHPNYASNGVFYVTYTDPIQAIGAANDQVLGRFTVSSNPDVANPTGTVVMRVPDIADNHNGGDIHFGPDGYLYWSMGDGGVQGDPNGFAQCRWKKTADGTTTCPTTISVAGSPLYYLLGKILRLDVDHTTASAQANACASTPGAAAQYSIPATNPYADLAVVANGTRCAEIWAYGLRNPFRFSFDRQTGDMFIGDVGYNTTEEVDFQSAASSSATGYNYGWRNCEGPFPQGLTAGTCSTGILPIMYYFHASGTVTGDAVIGGYRYRGPYTRLQGVYLFGDLDGGPLVGTFSTSWTLAAFTPPGGVPVGGVFGLGEDEVGNVYLANGYVGKVYKYILDEIFYDGFGP
jgi:glucose/arabinose dehydrogenase